MAESDCFRRTRLIADGYRLGAADHAVLADVLLRSAGVRGGARPMSRVGSGQTHKGAWIRLDGKVTPTRVRVMTSMVEEG